MRTNAGQDVEPTRGGGVGAAGERLQPPRRQGPPQQEQTTHADGNQVGGVKWSKKLSIFIFSRYVNGH